MSFHYKLRSVSYSERRFSEYIILNVTLVELTTREVRDFEFVTPLLKCQLITDCVSLS
jgi:hypothetical protein